MSAYLDLSFRLTMIDTVHYYMYINKLGPRPETEYGMNK